MATESKLNEAEKAVSGSCDCSAVCVYCDEPVDEPGTMCWECAEDAGEPTGSCAECGVDIYDDSEFGLCDHCACSECGCLGRTRDGTFPLLLTHHPDCRHFARELRNLVTNLVRGIEQWAIDADGVHPEAWEAYQAGKLAIGEPPGCGASRYDD